LKTGTSKPLKRLYLTRLKGTLRAFPIYLVAAFLGFVEFAPLVSAQEVPRYVWAKQLGDASQLGHGLAVDKTGNVYVTGIMGLKTHYSIGTHSRSTSGGAIFVAKYDGAGKMLWLETAGGSGTDAGTAVALDKTGNVYVTGYFAGSVKFGSIKLKAKEGAQTRGRMPADIFVAKYDPAGKPLWVRQAGGVGLDQGYGIAADKKGNVYVTGYFQGKATFGAMELMGRTQPDRSREFDDRYGDMFTAKYDGAGNLAWVRQAGDHGKNVGSSVAVDDAGHVYVTGRFEGGSIHFGELNVADTNLCNFLVKYGEDGTVLWAQPTAGPHFYYGGARSSIVVDHAGQVIVAGNFEISQQVGDILLQKDQGMNEEIFLLKYDQSGKLLWGRQAGGQAHEYCTGLAVDESGSAYITGSIDDVADFGHIHVQAGPHNPGITGTSVYVAKYNASGEPLWVKSAGPKSMDDANGYSAPQAIAVDGGQNVFITGGFLYSVTFGNTTLSTPRDLFGERRGAAFLVKLGTNGMGGQRIVR
jgi:hypothetical protein